MFKRNQADSSRLSLNAQKTIYLPLFRKQSILYYIFRRFLYFNSDFFRKLEFFS